MPIFVWTPTGASLLFAACVAQHADGVEGHTIGGLRQVRLQHMELPLLPRRQLHRRLQAECGQAALSGGAPWPSGSHEKRQIRFLFEKKPSWEIKV